MDGFIIINKPIGMSSHDVCFKLRKVYNTKKIGHTGTLDPLATGVLVVAVGKATKLIQYLENQKKTYIAEILFGIDTDTYDILGKIVNKCDEFDINNQIIDFALIELKETKTQIPPIYSAIKVNGKKLYDYALENKEVQIAPRPILIEELERVSDYKDKLCKVKIMANKGFYVRSLVHDLGVKLSCYATMKNLERTKAGNFDLSVAKELEDVLNGNNELLSIEETFSYLDRIDVSDYIAKLVKNGVVLDERQYNKKELFRVYNNDKLIAIYAPNEIDRYNLVVYLGE